MAFGFGYLYVLQEVVEWDLSDEVWRFQEYLYKKIDFPFKH